MLIGRARRAAAKNATVTRAGKTTNDKEAEADAPTPVAIANAPNWITSSTVAIAKTIFANRVSMILISMKIFEITGIEVIETPMPTMMARESVFPFGPEYGVKL